MSSLPLREARDRAIEVADLERRLVSLESERGVSIGSPERQN